MTILLLSGLSFFDMIRFNFSSFWKSTVCLSLGLTFWASDRINCYVHSSYRYSVLPLITDLLRRHSMAFNSFVQIFWLRNFHFPGCCHCIIIQCGNHKLNFCSSMVRISLSSNIAIMAFPFTHSLQEPLGPSQSLKYGWRTHITTISILKQG